MERTEEATRSEVEMGIRALSGKQSQAKSKTQSYRGRRKKKKKKRMGIVVRRAGAETCSLKNEL